MLQVKLIVFFMPFIFNHVLISMEEPNSSSSMVKSDSPKNTSQSPFRLNLTVLNLLNQIQSSWDQAQKIHDISNETDYNAFMKLACDAINFLCNAYEAGYEGALEDAEEILGEISKRQQTLDSQTFTVPESFKSSCEQLRLMRSKRENVIEKVHKIREAISPKYLVAPQTARTFTVFNEGFRHQIEIVRMIELLLKSRGEYLQNYCKFVRRACQSFYCAHKLGYPSAADKITLVLSQLSADNWTLPSSTIDTLLHIRDKLIRLSEIDPTPPREPSVIYSKPDKRVQSPSSSSIQHTTQDPIITAVTAFNNGIKLQAMMEASKKKGDYSNTLEFYKLILNQLLDSYHKGFPKGLIAAKALMEQCEVYISTLSHTAAIPLSLKDNMERTKTALKEYEDSLEKLRREKADSILDEDINYINALLDSMIAAYNDGFETHFKAHDLQSELLNKTHKLITLASAAATDAGTNYTQAVLECFMQAQEQIRACATLFFPCNWQLSEEQQRLIQDNHARIKKELEENKYNKLLEASYTNAKRQSTQKAHMNATKPVPIAWSTMLHDTAKRDDSPGQRSDGSSSDTAPTPAERAARADHQIPSSPSSPTSKKGKRLSGASKRLSTLLAEVTGLGDSSKDNRI